MAFSLPPLLSGNKKAVRKIAGVPRSVYVPCGHVSFFRGLSGFIQPVAKNTSFQTTSKVITDYLSCSATTSNMAYAIPTSSVLYCSTAKGLLG